MSRVGSPWRSRARGTTTGAPTQAKADTVPLNPPHSTRPLKPLAPHMTIRIPPNRLSSRAGAMESFQIRPRVGHSEIPSPAWLYHHHPKTTFCTLLLLLFLFPSSLHSISSSSCHFFCHVSSVCLFLSLQSFLYTSTFLWPFLHTSQSLSFMLFAFSWSVVLVAMMPPSSEA